MEFMAQRERWWSNNKTNTEFQTDGQQEGRLRAQWEPPTFSEGREVCPGSEAGEISWWELSSSGSFPQRAWGQNTDLGSPRASFREGTQSLNKSVPLPYSYTWRNWVKKSWNPRALLNKRQIWDQKPFSVFFFRSFIFQSWRRVFTPSLTFGRKRPDCFVYSLSSLLDKFMRPQGTLNSLEGGISSLFSHNPGMIRTWSGVQ